jgi:hypothetical protein
MDGSQTKTEIENSIKLIQIKKIWFTDDKTTLVRSALTKNLLLQCWHRGQPGKLVVSTNRVHLEASDPASRPGFKGVQKTMQLVQNYPQNIQNGMKNTRNMELFSCSALAGHI